MGRYYKIGYSKNPYKRLKSIDATLLPKKPELTYALMKYEDDERLFSKLEKEIHDYLNNYKARGEWFRNKNKMQEVIKKYKFEQIGILEANYIDEARPCSDHELQNFFSDEYGWED